MAANTARNLNQHYANLATSTRRLSSGLRINSAADDAAGLAIRELMRVDIAAFHQGARNANDAISMLQVADGALAIIDEKLIRMKELAEQAATGTYNSTQRLMIESEYQAMASEITRIANATDFNGIKLLDGSLVGKHDGSGLQSKGAMKIHFGAGNDSAEDYYYVEIGNCTSAALGVGNNAYVLEDKIDYVKKDIFEEVQKTFVSASEYVEYIDPTTGNKYYSDGNYYFSDIDDPAGSTVDWIKDGEVIERLETVPETITTYSSYSAKIDPQTNIEYYYYKGKYTTDPTKPDAIVLDESDSQDKAIIKRLENSSKSIFISDTWQVYSNDRGINFYTYDNGLSFVPDPAAPNSGILDSNNPDDLIVIKNLKPSMIKATSKVPVSNTTYDIYKDPITYTEYYSSDNGATFVLDGSRPEATKLDPKTDKEIIDRLVLQLDPEFSNTHFDRYYDPDTNTRYYTQDGGQTFVADPSKPDDISLDKNNIADQILINKLLPDEKTTWVYIKCDVYEDRTNPQKKYYSRDNGKTFFASITDPFTITLDSSNPKDNASIKNLIEVSSNVRISLPYTVYVDPVTKTNYYTRDNGNTFIIDRNNPDDIVLDIVNDKAFIDTLQLVPYVHTESVWYDTYKDPDNNQLYITQHYGNKEIYYNPGDYTNVSLDKTNSTDAVIIDRLQPVPWTRDFDVIREVPIITQIYQDPATGTNYYSPDNGKTFTTNPYDPDDMSSYLDPNDPDDEKIIENLEPAMATQKTGEMLEAVITPGDPIISDGYTISTQEAAQKAIVAINDAIVSKDKIRAHLGALQNRLENTISNLNMQAENLQAAESRISDVDVATEMTNFVRNQILTQSAVAMLGQANSMPQMLMQLISR